MRNILISSGWKEGRYVDLWSLNHFLLGVIAGSFFMIIHTSFWTALLISLALMIIWEIFEVVHDAFTEHIPNMIADVIIGLIGFLITQYVLTETASITPVLMLIISGILFTILEIVGFYNFAHRP